MSMDGEIGISHAGTVFFKIYTMIEGKPATVTVEWTPGVTREIAGRFLEAAKLAEKVTKDKMQ